MNAISRKSRVRRVNLCLEPQQHERLKAVALRKGLSMSEVVRDCVTAYLPSEEAPRKKPLFSFIGAARGGGEDVARNHDFYLYGWDKKK